jgi:hypothetical protein
MAGKDVAAAQQLIQDCPLLSTYSASAAICTTPHPNGAASAAVAAATAINARLVGSGVANVLCVVKGVCCSFTCDARHLTTLRLIILGIGISLHAACPVLLAVCMLIDAFSCILLTMLQRDLLQALAVLVQHFRCIINTSLCLADSQTTRQYNSTACNTRHALSLPKSLFAVLVRNIQRANVTTESKLGP